MIHKGWPAPRPVPPYVAPSGPPAPIYDVDAQAYFDELSTPLSTDREELIETFVIALRTAMGANALADAYDRIYLMANETENSGLVSLVNPTATIAENIHATPFTADRGFQGDGSNDYINSHYRPLTDGSAFELNSGSLAAYSRTNISAEEVELGTEVDGRTYLGMRVGGNYEGSLSQDSIISTPNPNSLGYHHISRTSSTYVEFYIDGGSKGQVNSGHNSTELDSGEMFLLAINWVGGLYHCSKEIALCMIMKGVTDQQASDIYDAIQIYMTAIGANVVHP